MVLASVLGVLSTRLWVALIGYVIFVFVQRSRGRPSKISVSIVAVLIVGALLFSTVETLAPNVA